MHIFKPPIYIFIYLFASNFATLYLFEILILVIEVMGNDDDVTKHGKIT
jgi:hypothetical protein